MNWSFSGSNCKNLPEGNRPNESKERRPNDTSAIAGIEAPQRGLHREVTRGQGPGACAPFRREVTRGKPRKTTNRLIGFNMAIKPY